MEDPSAKKAQSIQVKPLDAQFAADDPVIVPEELQEVFFGTSGLSTFAILDAAKIPNLPELLDQSELEHRCLFKGALEEDYRDAAPWVVNLDPSKPFVRFLFTQDDATQAPWFLWGMDAGIFARSPEPLEQVWRHFRKFTHVRDETGKWYYFRFWEPSFLNAFMTWPDPKSTVARDLRQTVAGGIDLFVPNNEGLAWYPAPDGERGNSMGARIDRGEMDDICWFLHKTELRERIAGELPADTIVTPENFDQIFEYGRHSGFPQGEALENYSTAYALALHNGYDFEEIHRRVSRDYPFNAKFLSRDLLSSVRAGGRDVCMTSCVDCPRSFLFVYGDPGAGDHSLGNGLRVAAQTHRKEIEANEFPYDVPEFRKDIDKSFVAHVGKGLLLKNLLNGHKGKLHYLSIFSHMGAGGRI